MKKYFNFDFLKEKDFNIKLNYDNELIKNILEELEDELLYESNDYIIDVINSICDDNVFIYSEDLYNACDSHLGFYINASLLELGLPEISPNFTEDLIRQGQFTYFNQCALDNINDILKRCILQKLEKEMFVFETKESSFERLKNELENYTIEYVENLCFDSDQKCNEIFLKYYYGAEKIIKSFPDVKEFKKMSDNPYTDDFSMLGLEIRVGETPRKIKISIIEECEKFKEIVKGDFDLTEIENTYTNNEYTIIHNTNYKNEKLGYNFSLRNYHRGIKGDNTVFDVINGNAVILKSLNDKLCSLNENDIDYLTNEITAIRNDENLFLGSAYLSCEENAFHIYSDEESISNKVDEASYQNSDYRF